MNPQIDRNTETIHDEEQNHYYETQPQRKASHHPHRATVILSDPI